MPFHPGDLPASVQSLFNKNIHAPMLWPAVVQEAVNKGIKDANKLADIIFYLHHPDLIGKPLTPGEANFTKLSEEWKAWKTFVQPAIREFSKPAASSEWEPYATSVWRDVSWLSSSVKQWLATPPSHEREAGLFKTGKSDNGRKLMFLAWKTTDPKANCVTHNLHEDHALHGWLERETSLAATKVKHSLRADWLSALGNDAGAKGISAMNIGMNKLMFHYVFKKGMCIQRAENTAGRKLREEAKAIMELVTAVVGGGAGAKGGGSGPEALPTRDHASLKLSELDWKGFVKQVRDVVDGDYGKSSDVNESAAGLTVHEKVRDGGDAIVGLVRHFD